MTSAPIVRTPRDIADLRTWLVEQWQPDKPYSQYLRAKGSSTDNMFESTSDVWERRNIAAAELYWVSEDMVDLLLATAASVPDDVTLNDLTPPFPQGMVVFAKSWYGHDAVDGTNDQLRIDAMIWGGSHLGPIPGDPKRGGKKGSLAVSTSMYRHLDFDLGMTAGDMQLAAATRAIILHATAFDKRPALNSDVEAMKAMNAGLDETPDLPKVDSPAAREFFKRHGRQPFEGDELTQTLAIHGHSWVPLGRSDWPVGDQITEAPWPMEDSMRLSFVEDRKVLAAMWILLQEEAIARQEVHHVERHAAKRAVRAGVTPETSYKVKVVTLRKLHRNETINPEHVGREWTHRWLVTGHFGWRRCGKQHLDRRIAFIPPHIKGPDDKPFRAPTRVYNWKR
jgi:hypothetical protein